MVQDCANFTMRISAIKFNTGQLLVKIKASANTAKT